MSDTEFHIRRWVLVCLWHAQCAFFNGLLALVEPFAPELVRQERWRQRLFEAHLPPLVKEDLGLKK